MFPFFGSKKTEPQTPYPSAPPPGSSFPSHNGYPQSGQYPPGSYPSGGQYPPGSYPSGGQHPQSDPFPPNGSFQEGGSVPQYPQPPPSYPASTFSQQPVHIGTDIGGVHIGATFGGGYAPQPMVQQPGYYEITKGAFGKVYYFRYRGDPNPIEVDVSFANKFHDLGGGYGKDTFNVYYEGQQIDFDGFADRFKVTDAMGRKAQDSHGNLYIYGKKQ